MRTSKRIMKIWVCNHFFFFLKIRYLYFFSNFLLGIFFIYISNAIPKVPYTLPPALLPYPLTPTSWAWCSPVLGHIQFACPMGLSFQWWPTRPSFDTYAARVRYFLYIHFKCYPESSLYPPSTLLPYPPTPASWPWHSPLLGHIKFAIPKGLSSQWWPTRPSSATFAARDKSSGDTG